MSNLKESKKVLIALRVSVNILRSIDGLAKAQRRNRSNYIELLLLQEVKRNAVKGGSARIIS